MQFQQMYISMFGLWSGLETDVSNVDPSGSADQTPSVRPSGCLTDRVQRVRPLDSQNEELLSTSTSSALS